MSDLLAADMRRLLWRPISRALGGISITVVAVIGVIVFVHSGTKHPFNPPSGIRNALGNATTPLALAAFILGASMFGADYPSRALTTLFTWEPRRARVLTSRAVACATVTAGASVALLVLLLLALLPASLAHGTGPAPNATWYVSTAGLAVRCALLAAAVSVIGVSAAAIGRSTAAALAAVGVYVLVVERAAISAAPSVGRWLVVADAVSWIALTRQQQIGGQGNHANGHTIVTAGLLLLAGVVFLLGLASTVLKHRDLA